MNQEEDKEMAFNDSGRGDGPSFRQNNVGGTPGQHLQPGAYQDSMADSDLSAGVDQISIKLSESVQSQIEEEQEAVDPQDIQGQIENSENNADYNSGNLSEGNYRSAVSQSQANRHAIPESSVPSAGIVNYDYQEQNEDALSPDAKRSISHQLSDSKLIDKSDVTDAVAPPSAQSGSTHHLEDDHSHRLVNEPRRTTQLEQALTAQNKAQDQLEQPAHWPQAQQEISAMGLIQNSPVQSSGQEESSATGTQGKDNKKTDGTRLPEMPEKEDEGDFGLVTNPICRRFFSILRVTGTVIMVCALVADFGYAFKQTFSSKELFVAYLSVLGFRCIIPCFIAVKNVCRKVCNKQNNYIGIDEQTQKRHTKDGCLLYSVLPLTYFTGSYRLLDFKNFPSEVGFGLLLDFFFNALPLLFIQAVNNATLVQQDLDSGSLFKFSGLQTFCIMSKVLLIADIVLEFFMFLYEIYKLHHLEKQTINVIVRYNEQERRQIFARRYACRILCWLGIILASIIMVGLFVDPATCREDQAAEWGSICFNCKTEFCASCSEAGQDGCDTCKDGFYVDEETGECLDATCQVKHCGECQESGVLGCDACFEGFVVWELLGICKSTACLVDYCDDCALAGPNGCDACLEGFEFNRQTGLCEDRVCKVDLCKTCTQSGVRACDECEEGHYYDEQRGLCRAQDDCAVDYCDVCKDPKICDDDKCANNYWHDKLNNQCIDGTCDPSLNCFNCDVTGPSGCDECNDGYFMKDGKCYDCDSLPESVICKECENEAVCTACADGFRLDPVLKECKACEKETCKVCNNQNGRCEKCKDGYYTDIDSGTCQPCKEGCLACSSYDFCTTCDIAIHNLESPENGDCYCDKARGWYPKATDLPWRCECQFEFLTTDGECTTCQNHFEQCNTCEKVELGEDETFPLGLTVVQNPNQPLREAGIYKCANCTETYHYYNHQVKECVSCDARLPGCFDCSMGEDYTDAKYCNTCHGTWVLDDDAKCIDCRLRDSACIECTANLCTRCADGFSLLNISDGFCIQNFWGL